MWKRNNQASEATKDVASKITDDVVDTTANAEADQSAEADQNKNPTSEQNKEEGELKTFTVEVPFSHEWKMYKKGDKVKAVSEKIFWPGWVK